MQAVIMAAGRGTRMAHLTTEVPKPMLVVAGKTLLEHKLDILPEEIDEIIMVIGYQGAVIKNHFGDSYHGIPVRYVEQGELNGTAGAVWAARPFLHGTFMVISGDDLYGREDFARMAQEEWAILGIEVADTSGTGKMILDESGKIVSILERTDHTGGPGIVNAALYTLDMRLFDYPMVGMSYKSAEYGLPQTIIATGIPATYVPATLWLQGTKPEDLEEMEKSLSTPL